MTRPQSAVIFSIFRVNIIGKRIRVLACNFIPLKHFCGGGFLEIIKWSFVDSTSSVISSISSSLHLFPLVSSSPSNEEDHSKARYRVNGPIESISPVFIVPCSIGDSKSQNLRGNGHCSRENVIRGNGECGVYTGVVRGVYMQGMVVELDKEVWLLLTDQQVTAPHSLREGAIISARNVHFVNPKFSWTKMLVLGACFKTSITVESFSPLETGCHMVAQSQNQLGKFIESLTFSARLWTLLVISCFRKKFTGILSEKEILGSKHKEGLVQMFARSHLPASIFRARLGVLSELCRHESCGCGSEPYHGNLKLVAPISILLSHCENMWTRTVSKDCHASQEKPPFNFPSYEMMSYCLPSRRSFSSEDIGILLLGSLKISPSSGRLQLVDATGSIDVLIPDLPSTWRTTNIYEVVDYSLIMEGMPKVMDRLGLLNNESLSCSHIFHYVPRAIEMNLAIYSYFHLSSVTCKNLCFYPSVPFNEDLQELQSGIFHLIWISHKYPLLQQLQGDPVIPNRANVFVEAVVLPWDLSIAGMDPIAHSAMFGSELSAYSGSLRESTKWKCGETSCPEIQCLAITRNANSHNMVSSGKLCCTNCKVKIGADYKPSGRKVLLEFSSDSLFIYQSLQIGGYYVIKHHEEESFCSLKDYNNIGGGKICVSSRICPWSLSFSSDDVTNDKSLHDAPPGGSSLSNEEVLMKNQVELLLRRSTGNSPECSDVQLHLSANIMHLFGLKLNKMKEGFMPVVMPEEAFNGSPHSMTKMSAGSSCVFPEGNLITVLGNVVAFHFLNSNLDNAHSSCETISDIPHMGCFQGIPNSCCVHVLVDKQMVRIFGSLSKHSYAVGFGAGVNATFHRVLKWRSCMSNNDNALHQLVFILTVRGTDRLMLLTPASFIVINSIRVANEASQENSSDLWLYRSSLASLDRVSFVMISELNQCTESKPMKFYCRVVAVHFLVLENRKYDLASKVHSRQHFLDIPLASFVLDDGSSSCYCWANAERAATLLRLHEELPMRAFESSDCTLKWVGIKKSSWKTTIYHLERMLKKHHRIVVKNHGSMVDSSYQDLNVSVSSDDDLSSSDDNLLKFIIFHACIGTFWTVTASAMELNAVNQLEKEHLMQMDMALHPMQNVWAREVCYTDTRTEAWNMVQEQLRRGAGCIILRVQGPLWVTEPKLTEPFQNRTLKRIPTK
ncbi:hypothetical protein OIU84_012918 [Salix udensis]|uniref:CST complex subunit CTC1 n=1 Tax=Salix udensis TaxID=889485 RepID=A0AAD6JHI6_9ROSI|nr:hypothetical protein OIU84_012918 [Salix udensis]